MWDFCSLRRLGIRNRRSARSKILGKIRVCTTSVRSPEPSWCFLATLFLLLHFASLSHFHSCARSFFTILSRSCCHFLSHSFLHSVSRSCSCSRWYVVFSLACCSPPSLIVLYGFIHSNFVIFWFW